MESHKQSSTVALGVMLYKQLAEWVDEDSAALHIPRTRWLSVAYPKELSFPLM